MIKFFSKKKNQKMMFIGLAVIIIPSFLLFGVVSSLDDDNKSPSVMGHIAKKKVSFRDYLSSYQAVYRQSMLNFGDRFYELRQYMDLKNDAWDRLLLLGYAKKHWIKATDAEVLEWLMRQPTFQQNEQFDKIAYGRFITEYLRTDPKTFEEEIRQMLTVAKIAGKTRNSIKINDSQLKKMYIQQNAEKDFDYAIMDWKSEEIEATPTEEELRSIYNLLKEQLSQPAQAKISYVFVPKEDAKKQEDILLNNEISFEDLSKKHGLSIEETSYFLNNSPVPDIGTSPQISFLSFSLEPGKESDWVKITDKGHYKIKVLDRKSQRELAFEETKDILEEFYLKQKATQATTEKMKELKKEMEISDFKTVLEGEEIEIKKAEKFTQGDLLAGIGPKEPIDKILTDTKEGEISEVFAISNGAAILQVTKIWPIEEENFEKEKEEFRETMMNREVSEQFNTLLQKLRKDLKVNQEAMDAIFDK